MGTNANYRYAGGRFGAVVEEFEVWDVLDTLLSGKGTTAVAAGPETSY